MSDFDTSDKLGACPNCDGEFSSVQVGPYTVDRCSNCAGLWLDEIYVYEKVTSGLPVILKTVHFVHFLQIKVAGVDAVEWIGARADAVRDHAQAVRVDALLSQQLPCGGVRHDDPGQQAQNREVATSRLRRLQPAPPVHRLKNGNPRRHAAHRVLDQGSPRRLNAVP